MCYFPDDHPSKHTCHTSKLSRHLDGLLKDVCQRQSVCKFLQPLHLFHLPSSQQQQQPPAPHNGRLRHATRTAIDAKRRLLSFSNKPARSHTKMDSFLVELYSSLPVLVKLLALCDRKELSFDSAESNGVALVLGPPHFALQGRKGLFFDSSKSNRVAVVLGHPRFALQDRQELSFDSEKSIGVALILGHPRFALQRTKRMDEWRSVDETRVYGLGFCEPPPICV